MQYDIIGDLHGHADHLIALLTKMGYRETQDAWRHPERQALFVGDFIDRGPQQIKTVMIVRRMVEAGSAQAVMGNHELNAIAWFLPDPDQPNDFLRSHHSPQYGETNRRQHAAFLAEVEHNPVLHQEIIDWFLSLPLWLELPELRLVHACWHPPFIEFLKPLLVNGCYLSPELMVVASREPNDLADKDDPQPSVFKAVEALTKGIETPLPAGHHFIDKDQITRRRVRLRWWDAAADTYQTAAMLDSSIRAQLPALPIPPHQRLPYQSHQPLFIGHYWLTGEPAPLSNQVACVDYSIAKHGKLCAYRWQGEKIL